MLYLDKWRYLKRLLIFIIFSLTFLVIIYSPPNDIRHSKEVPVIGWDLNRTRDTYVYIAPENDTVIINGRDICDNKTNLVIVVMSRPCHTNQREAIRQTWARHNVTFIKILFLLGLSDNISQEKIEEESIIYQDIVQERFVDSYNNLTIKSVMMLKWFLRYCPKPRYLMKTDDDMFINITLLSKIATGLSKINILIGTLINHAKPIKDSSHKWYSPRYMYRGDMFPRYLSGTAYLMSRDVAEKIYEAALTTPLFHLEDIFITGICSRKVGVKPRGHPSFAYDKLKDIGCHPFLVTIHGFSPSQLLLSWDQRFNCSKPLSTQSSNLTSRIPP